MKNVLLARASFLLTLLPLLANAAPTRAPADLAVTTQDPTFGEQAGIINNQADATLVGGGASSSSHDSSWIERCPICLGPFGDEEVNTTVCAHKFHKHCLDNWKRSVHADDNRELTCPVCRTPLEGRPRPISQRLECDLCHRNRSDRGLVFTLQCGHSFHFACLLRHYRRVSNQRRIKFDVKRPISV